MINIAILASGGGSNAREICNYFSKHAVVRVSVLISNRSDAGVHSVATDFGISSLTLKKSQFGDCQFILDTLIHYQVDYIVLAGFLLLIPDCVIEAYQKKILNIHPSLLPKYGGQGMYGHYVHEAVKENNDLKTGMTVHLVNDKYDEGEILFQTSCDINPSMTSDEIAVNVLKLEHKYYSPTIENYILSHKFVLKTN